MTAEPVPDEPTIDPRVAPMRRVVVWGAVTGLLLALVVGVAGGTGRAGMAVLLLVSALACGMSAVYGLVTSVVDEFRDRPVSRRRIGGMVGAFFGAAALMSMVAGIGG